MKYHRIQFNISALLSGSLLGLGSLHSSTQADAQFFWALWCCFFIGLYAVVFPHSLFQGKLRTRWLLSAPPVKKVILDQLSLTFWIPGLSLSFISMWGWSTGFPLEHILYRTAQLCLWYFISLFLATYTGKVAQDFKTGLRGNKLREFAKETGSFPVAIGSIPTFVQTILVTTFGLLHLLLFDVHSLISHTILYVGFGSVLLFMVFMNKPRYFSRSLQGEAFFGEYFARLSNSLSQERPLNSLYWVPTSFKLSTKMLLTLSDRNGAVHQWYWPGLLLGAGAHWLFPEFSLIWAIGILLLYSSESIRIAQILYKSRHFYIRLQSSIHFSISLILCSLRWNLWFSILFWIILPSSFLPYFILLLFITPIFVSVVIYFLLTSTLTPKYA